MRRVIFLFFTMIYIQSVHADFWSDFTNVSYTDTTYNATITNLTSDANASGQYIKDKEGYWLGTLEGRIDILGFRNVARIDGIDYINTSIEKSTILNYSVWYSFREKCGQCYLISMKENVSINYARDNITAWYNVTMLWNRTHWVWCGEGCWYSINETRKNYLNISDTYKSPKIFNSSASVDVIEYVYNISVSPVITLYLRISPAITKYSVVTENGSITRRFLIGQVQYNSKGFPYTNFSRYDFTDIQGTGISTLNNDIVISGMDENITYYFYSPFGKLNLTPTIHRKILKNKIDYPALNYTIYFSLSLGLFYLTLKRLKQLAWR